MSENLMPIRYNLAPITDVIRKIDPAKAAAFDAAISRIIEDNGLLDQVDYTEKCVKKNLRFGVAQGDGTAISSYSESPVRELRSAAILSLPNQEDPVFGGVTSIYPFVTYDVVWDTDENAVSAFFATFIRDNSKLCFLVILNLLTT